MNTFSIRESFGRGWSLFKTHKSLFVLAGLISLILNGGQKGRGILGVLFFIVSLLAQVGLIKIFLKLLDGEEAKIGEVFNYGELFIRYLIVYVLFALGFIVGMVLLIVPGIWFALTYTFAPVLSIDKKLGFKEAFRESARLTKGHKGKIALLILALIGANIIGALCLVVGLLVSVPVSSVAYLAVYRKLQGQAA